MPLADEWRISCQSLLVSGDGFEPRLQHNSLWLTSSAIFTLNLDNIWLNKSKVIISQLDKLFKTSPGLQLLQTALTKKKRWRIFTWELLRFQPRGWEISTTQNKALLEHERATVEFHLSSHGPQPFSCSPQTSGTQTPEEQHCSCSVTAQQILSFLCESLIGSSLAELEWFQTVGSWERIIINWHHFLSAHTNTF